MNENFYVFNSRDETYLVFTKKSKFSFYFVLFRRFTANQIKPNDNNVKEDKGVLMTEYLDQST